MKLIEVAGSHLHPLDQVAQKFKNLLSKDHTKPQYTIRPDGTVDVDGSVIIRRTFKGTSFPVKFGRVAGTFDCDNMLLTSLQGLPSDVGGDIFCSLLSLTGINKVIKHVGGSFICETMPTHVLGLLLIPGIERIYIDSNTATGKINAIMNKYLPTHNVLMAQDELIDAGFIEQAKL